MRTASGLAMLVAMLLLLGVAGGAMKLYMDRQSMADVIGSYGQTLTSLPVSSPEAAQAFASATDSARAGRFAEAQTLLKQGAQAATQAAPAMPGMPGMPQIPGMGQPGAADEPTDEQVREALQSVPENARPFFEKRPQLFRRALALSMAARQVVPDKWPPQREKIFQAAAANDEERMTELLQLIPRELGLDRPGGFERGGRGRGGAGGPGGAGMPGGMPAAPEQLAAAIAQARQMLGQAQAAGLDTSKVVAIVDRADRELKGGNAQKAAASLREAFEVAQAAMRGGGPAGPPGGGRGMRGGPGGGPPGGFRPGMGARRPGGTRGGPPGMGMPPGGRGMGPGGMAMGPGPQGQGMFPGIFASLMGAMREESGVLSGVIDDIDNAALAIREKNQDQVREILAAAKSKVLGIGETRERLGGELQAMQGPPGMGPGMSGPGPRPGGRRPGGERPGGQGPGTGPGGWPMLPGMGPGGPFDMQRIHDVIGRALDEVRQMPDDQYETERDGFVMRLMGSLVAAVTGQEMTLSPDEVAAGRGSTGLPPIVVPAEEPTDPAARKELETQVRNRLRLLQEPCAVLAQTGADLAQVQVALTQARGAVNAGTLVEAAKATNQVADMVWQLVDTHKAELEALRQQTETGKAQQPPAGEGAP